MIKILTEDIELLKKACKNLAYELAMETGSPFRYTVPNEEIVSILKCKGLETEVK